jgi:hypothetical protein
MKCKQKRCQRLKNIKPNGNCNVCDDAIVEAVKNDGKKTTRANENVEIDMNIMLETHNKLSNGIPIDSTVVSSLLLLQQICQM